MRKFSPVALCSFFRFLENFRSLTIVAPFLLQSYSDVCPFQDLFVHLPTLEKAYKLLTPSRVG